MQDSFNKTGAVAFDTYLAHLSAADRFRILMDNSFDWDFWQLPDGSFEYVSPSCLQITGYSAAEFMRYPDLYFQIIHPDDRQRVNSHHCRPGRKGVSSLEFRITRKDGQECWIDHVCRRIEDEQGHFLGCRASNRDITAKKTAELRFHQKAVEAEANSYLLKSIIEYTPIGIVVVSSPEMKIRLISDRGCELEGRSREELERFSAEQYQFVHPDGTIADNEQVPLTRAVLQGELVTDEEWIVLRPDGIRVNILCHAGPIYDDQGNITGGVLVWQDITRRKKNEQGLERSRRRLIELKEQLENKNREMESIIGTVSHDLRSPLVSIQGFSREIQLSIENAARTIATYNLTEAQLGPLELIFDREIPEFLGYIKASAQAMDQLVKSLVKVARAGMAQLDPEMLDMDELLSNVTGAMGFAIKEAQIELDLQPLPDCYADRQQVTQIFANLLDNAIKYRKLDQAGSIKVYGCKQGELSCYMVEDNGIGIPPEFQDKVFNLFDRVPGQGKGEGIGLAMVKRMAERNNGHVRLDSQPGQGTCFYVCLPSLKQDLLQ